MRHLLCCAVFLCLVIGSQWFAKGAEASAPRRAAAVYCCCCAANRRVTPGNLAEMREADDVPVVVAGAVAPAQEEMAPRERFTQLSLLCADGSTWFFRQMREGLIVRVVLCRACHEEELARRREPEHADGPRQRDECSELVECIDGCYMSVLDRASRGFECCLPVAASVCEPCRMRQCAESTVRCCVCASCCPVATAGAAATLPCLASCFVMMLAGGGGGTSA